MGRLGVDYAWGRPGGAAIRAAGYTFAVRYIDYPGAAGKGITADEVVDLHSNGVAIVLVFESLASRALSGKPAGDYDANMVRQQLARLNWPQDRPVYFAVDFEASATELPAIDD